MICAHLRGGPKDGEILAIHADSTAIAFGVFAATPYWNSPLIAGDLVEDFVEQLLYKQGRFIEGHGGNCFEYTCLDGVGIGGIDWLAT